MPSLRASAPNAAIGLGVGHRRVLGAAEVAQPGVLGPHRRVVEPGRDGVRQLDVAGRVLQDVAAGSLQDAGGAGGEARRVAPRDECLAARLDADQADRGVVDEAVEDPERVAAAADARHDRIRGATGQVAVLGPRLAPDHGLELPHHQRIGMRPEHGPEQVVGVSDVGHPVAHRLVDGVLERPAAGVDARDRGPEEPHAVDVQRLPRHVVGAHVDDALQAEERTGGGRRHPVLAGARLGHDPALAHADGEQGLSQGVVDLVGAGVGPGPPA